MSKIWNADFAKVVPEGAAGNQAQLGIFYRDFKGLIKRLTQAEGNERSLNPEEKETNPIGQEAPSTVIRSYSMAFDKDVIIEKGEENYEFFSEFARLRPTGKNAVLETYLVDFRKEEAGEKHNRYYAEKMDATVTVNTINETDGIISVHFAQDGDLTIGVMERTDTSVVDDPSTFTYGFTSSEQIAVTGITTSLDEVEISAGEQARAAVSFSPLGCPYDFKVESDSDAVAVSRWNQSVDIKGRKAGTATVTITSVSNPTIKADIEVTVS